MKNFLKTFFDYVKGNGRVEYTAVTIGDDFSEGFEELVKKNRNLLSDHGVNLNKVRFVYTPVFTYDIDKNTIKICIFRGGPHNIYVYFLYCLSCC